MAKTYGFDKSGVERIIGVVRRIEATPQGMVAPAIPGHRSDAAIVWCELQSELRSNNTVGAKYVVDGQIVDDLGTFRVQDILGWLGSSKLAAHKRCLGAWIGSTSTQPACALLAYNCTDTST